jgi:hypothetical protein
VRIQFCISTTGFLSGIPLFIKANSMNQRINSFNSKIAGLAELFITAVSDIFAQSQHLRSAMLFIGNCQLISLAKTESSYVFSVCPHP